MCDNHDYCEILMPDAKHKILKYTTGSKSLKVAYAIYVDIQCQLKKHVTCANDQNKSWSKNINTHIPTRYSINVVNEYKENFHKYHRGIDCMNRLSKDLLRIGK